MYCCNARLQVFIVWMSCVSQDRTSVCVCECVCVCVCECVSVCVCECVRFRVYM